MLTAEDSFAEVHKVYLSTHEIMPSNEDIRKKIVSGSSSRMLQMHFLLSQAHTHRAMSCI